MSTYCFGVYNRLPITGFISIMVLVSLLLGTLLQPLTYLGITLVPLLLETLLIKRQISNYVIIRNIIISPQLSLGITLVPLVLQILLSLLQIANYVTIILLPLVLGITLLIFYYLYPKLISSLFPLQYLPLAFNHLPMQTILLGKINQILLWGTLTLTMPFVMMNPMLLL